MCHQPFVEVHHITPVKDGGVHILDNAAPLCSACHDLYGGNPEKRKQIREMRDQWWIMMRDRAIALTVGELDAAATIDPDLRASGKLRNVVCIYHVVFANDSFESAARMLWDLVVAAQQREPGRPRWLFPDIEGHRDKAGGFEHDMWELQRHFVLGPLFRYLKHAYTPLLDVANPKAQRNDVPDVFDIVSADRSLPETVAATTTDADIFVGDADKWISVKGTS